MTFLGLAGIGDLIATCTSPLSRNRTFGENLGRGLTVDQTIAKTKQTCEGVKSCQSILDLATHATVSTCPSPIRLSRSSITGWHRAKCSATSCPAIPRPSRVTTVCHRSTVGRDLVVHPSGESLWLDGYVPLREMPEVVAPLDLMGLRNDRVAQWGQSGAALARRG